MDLRATIASPDALRDLPTTGRRIDVQDVVVPDGYSVEPVAAGLSFSSGMTVADDGTIYISAGGSTWPTRPYMPSRLLEVVTFTVMSEQFAHHRQLQELVLDMAPIAILYEQEI